eukprot:6441507-Alexandrium_andersonii.AAC.1
MATRTGWETSERGAPPLAVLSRWAVPCWPPTPTPSMSSRCPPERPRCAAWGRWPARPYTSRTSSGAWASRCASA